MERRSAASFGSTSATAAICTVSRLRSGGRTAAAEAAQVHGGLGGLRLSEFACQGPERIPEPVQVACRRRIAGFQRSYFDSRGVHEWCREHLAIIEAVASGDHAQAASRMRARLEQALIAAQAAAR